MINTLIQVTGEQDNKSIASFFNDGRRIQYSAGESIIGDSSEPDGVYFITEGFVRTRSSSNTGDASLLLIHKPNEIIPLPWALDNNQGADLSYIAINRTKVIKSSKEKLLMAMGNNMWLTHEILNQAVNLLAIYTKRIQTLEYKSAPKRVVAELLFLAERFGVVENNLIIIKAPITHQDIAQSINMNRETASRAIGRLADDGLIGQSGHLFTIHDLEGLKKRLFAQI